MDRGNFERDQIAHEAEDVWTPPTTFFAREDQEFDGLGHDQFRVLRVLIRYEMPTALTAGDAFRHLVRQHG